MEDIDRQLKLSYAAGIIDGEGSIDCCVSPVRGTRKNPSHRIRVKVSMCDMDSIVVLQELFGGKAPIRLRSHLLRNQRPIFEWCIRSFRAVSALNEMLPYLRLKRRKALVAIELGKRVSSNSHGRVISFGELDERTKLYQRLRNMNGRGMSELNVEFGK
mgnify:CR=1 FL=1